MTELISNRMETTIKVARNVDVFDRVQLWTNMFDSNNDHQGASTIQLNDSCIIVMYSLLLYNQTCIKMK